MITISYIILALASTKHKIVDMNSKTLPNVKYVWGDRPSVPTYSLEKPMLLERIKIYNKFHEGTRLQVHPQSGADSLLVDGPLRIYWDVKKTISFQKLDDTVPEKEKVSFRESYSAEIAAGLDDASAKKSSAALKLSDNQGAQEVDPLMKTLRLDDLPPNQDEQMRYNTIGGVVMRKRKKLKRTKRRQSMINGHIYDLDTSNFTPTDGSVTSVRINSHQTTTAVIRLLLHKFKVQNNPDEFCLCSERKTGETKILKPTDYPLMERIIMGPLEEEAKIYLRDTSHVKDISNEVASFMNLPEPMLNSFLQKLDDEERNERQKIIVKYQRVKFDIEHRLEELETPSWGID